MIRKLFVGLLMVGIGSYLWMGNAGDYARTFWSDASDYVESQVPIETQIKVARQKLKEFSPDIERARRQIAEQEVRVRGLEREIAQIAEGQEQSKLRIVALRDKLNQQLASYQIGRTTYTREELRVDLNKRFEGLKQTDERLKLKEATLNSYVKALESNQVKVRAMVDAKDQLESKIAELEARLRMVQAQQAGSEFKIDDTDAHKINELIGSISKRIEVEEILMQDSGPVKAVQDEDIAPTDLESQIDQYLGREADAAKTSATSL